MRHFNGQLTSISSYDLREDGEGRHWSDESIFGSRAHFSVTSAYLLTLRGVQREDAGLYRCRVDYESGPSRTAAVQLKVVGKKYGQSF